MPHDMWHRDAHQDAVLQHCGFTITDPGAREAYRPWIEEMLLGAAKKVEGLNFLANEAICQTVWQAFLDRSPLRHLAIVYRSTEAWATELFANLSTCSTLETLRIEKRGQQQWGCSDLPELHLDTMPKLRRMELLGCFTENSISLPPEC